MARTDFKKINQVMDNFIHYWKFEVVEKMLVAMEELKAIIIPYYL